MGYWTLFTLRIVARLGLATAVVLLVAGQFGPSQFSHTTGSLYLHAESRQSSAIVLWSSNLMGFVLKSDSSSPFLNVSIQLAPGEAVYAHVATLHNQTQLLAAQGWIPMFPTQPIQQLPGIRYSRGELGESGMRVDHWLLCLTFLIATIATSVRWRKPVDAGVTEAEA